MKTILCVLALVLTLSSADEAQAKFVKQGNCGSAKVVEGDTCSNAKVEFNFDGCNAKSNPQVVSNVACSQKTITATARIDNFKYTASFEKTEDKWGSVYWNKLGDVEQFEKQGSDKAVAKEPVKKSSPKVASKAHIVPPVAAEVRAPTADTTAVAAPVAVPQVAAAESGKLKFNGYFDVRLTTVTNKDPATNGNPESGFLLDDGAFYLNYEKGNYAFTFDIPFRRAKPSDNENPPAGNQSASNTSKVNFGVDKAQIFGRVKIHPSVTLQMGQWDTPYGVELNDSKDRTFLKGGLIYDYMLPVTHTGLMVDSTIGVVGFKIFAANSNNKGSLGDSSTGDNSYEYGTAISYSNETYRCQLGYLTRPITKADTTAGGTRNLADLTVGLTMGKVTFDMEYANLDDASKNTLTPSNSADKENAGTGILALMNYNFTDVYSAGLRYEEVQNDPSQASKKTSNSYSAIVKYKPAADFETRIEYGDYKFQNVNNTTSEQTRVNLAGLFFF